ncbi:MAG: DUF1611 domain-containing protein [Pirellulales bacterium]|nr:DUF1611 domain-containing protein [Pirellulales bacterium]
MSDSATRRLVILTEGHTEPITGKTASCVIRYRPEEVVALLDSTQAGRTTQELLGVGGATPVVATLDEAQGANTLMIGIAPSGGRIPPSWKAIILESLNRGMDVVSGLHEFISSTPEFAAAAEKSGAKIVDVRKNNERDVARRLNIREECLRIHTVGQDCCVGKMLVAVELANAMKARGYAAKFVATGQTGILVEGDGVPIDCVVSDFVNGAIEKQVLAHQHHDMLFIEGQGSLAHPKYSAVTLGLLHGCAPHGMIMCYEAGRTAIHSMEYVGLKPLPVLIEAYEMMANLISPSKVIGIAINSRCLNDQQAAEERERVRSELGLPACDVLRDGTDELVQAILSMRPELAGR